MSDRLTIVEIKRNANTVRVRYPELTDEEKRAKNFRLVQVGHLPTQPGWWMPQWVYWFGGRLWDGDRAITANSPEMLQTFQWLRQAPEKFGVENLRSFGASFGNFASPSDPFLAGQVAMVLQGVWMYNFISKFAPHLEWAAAPFPAKDPARFPRVTLAECDVLLIPKGAPHPKEAFEFIRYVNSPAPMEKLCLGQRKFSPLVKVSDRFLRDHPNPHIGTFMDLARSPNAQTVPRLTVWAEYNDELNVAADRVISLEATPQAALDQVQQRIQWRLDRVMRRWDAVKAERWREWSEYDAR
jgi:ABC-type glycerol-3-phosphate transport system substrate-binding protein